MASSDWVGEGETPPLSDRTWWDTAKSVGQTADDTVRAAANAMTFGMADRLAGYMGGEGTDAEVAKSEAARARSPYASVVGDVGGSLALPGFGAEALAARGVPALAGRVGLSVAPSGMAARALGYGGTGLVTGAAQGAGNTYTGNISEYARNALIGGALGGTLGAAGGAAFGARPVRSAAEVPSIPELYQYKSQRYDALNSNPARYDAQHLADVANNLENRFYTTADRYSRRGSPTSFEALDEMRQPYAAAVQAGPAAIATVDPGNLDIIRKGMRDLPYGPDRAASRHVRAEIDNFVENPPMGAVMPGSEHAAAIASRQSELARESNAAYKRAVRVDAMENNARNQAASNYSGLNVENNLRQQYRQLLAVNKETGRSLAQEKGYSPEEIQTFQNFVNGVDTPGRNALRWAAKTAGGGSGLGALTAAGVGGAAGGAYTQDDPRYAGMLALPLAGLAARTAGNRIALDQVRQMGEAIRRRSPLYTERANVAPMVPGFGSARATKGARDAIALELLKQTQPQRLTIDTTDWQ